MFKLLIIAAAGFILYKLLTNDKKKKSEMQNKKTQAETQKAAQSGEMVKDPICGTYVPYDSDIRVRKDGKVLHFCSFECRDEYLKQLETKPDKEKELS
jgi:YHS domain-containing protein